MKISFKYMNYLHTTCSDGSSCISTAAAQIPDV